MQEWLTLGQVQKLLVKDHVSFSGAPSGGQELSSVTPETSGRRKILRSEERKGKLGQLPNQIISRILCFVIARPSKADVAGRRCCIVTHMPPRTHRAACLPVCSRTPIIDAVQGQSTRVLPYWNCLQESDRVTEGRHHDAYFGCVHRKWQEVARTTKALWAHLSFRGLPTAHVTDQLVHRLSSKCLYTLSWCSGCNCSRDFADNVGHLIQSVDFDGCFNLTDESLSVLSEW
jgi:hypothetical protein